MNKKTILWSISIIILGSFVTYGTLSLLRYFDFRQQPKEKQKETGTEQKELTEEEFLNSLANSKYKEKEITAEDIKNLESLKSEIKPLSEEEKAKELEFLGSLKAPIK